MHKSHDAILECDEGCLYTEYSAARLNSTKYSGLPRCIRHGLVLVYAARWADGMTIGEARKHRKLSKAEGR